MKQQFRNLLFVFALLAPVPPLPAKDLNLFMKKDKWVYINGQEYPGSVGSMEIEKIDDKKAVKLVYDFKDAGAYIAAGYPVELRKAALIRFKCKTDKVSGIGLRVVDKDGECFQFPLKYSKINDWETFAVDLSEAPKKESWGPQDKANATNKEIDFPITHLSVLVGSRDFSDDQRTGSIWFSDFEVEDEKPLPPSSP